MITLTEAVDCIEEEYNHAISVYQYEDHIRFTNGSAGHYANIRRSGSSFKLGGERDGERINKECAATRDALLSTLSSTF